MVPMIRRCRRNRTICVLAIAVLVWSASSTLRAQESRRLQPRWWFGGAAAANFNSYSSDIRTLNAAATPTPLSAAFTKGSGTGLYLAPLIEYRPDPIWGGMLTIGFDSRRGSFDDITVAGTTHALSTAMNYLSVEPSVRVSPFDVGLHFFGGPRFGFNVAKSFTHEPAGAPRVEGEWSGARGTAVGLQVGAGFDIPLSPPDAESQVNLTPFVALHAGQGPRSEESWSLTTVRTGMAIKFGSAAEVRRMVEREVQFSLRAPRIIPSERRVNETFPMRNYVFFDGASTQVPNRYVRLSRQDASNFKEEQLVEPQPKDLTGRSRRQLTVYHNVLNILGDRMRRYPNAMVALTGSSDRGSASGRAYADAIKQYLVDVFGIDAARIRTEGRDKPAIPSSQAGGVRELDLVQPEDRRVEIASTTPELLDPVQIVSLQEDPLDSDVLFNVSGAEELLASWSVEVVDEQGGSKRFGPFTRDQERIPGRQILGERLQGQYNVAMVGVTKGGGTVRKEEAVRLVRSDEPESDLGLRFSILFEFDQSKTVATYERFLTRTVAPLIPDGGSVIIHGHTDIVGEESHNLRLSRERAQQAMNVIERALTNAGKRRVRFDTYGFGEDPRRAPFENTLPEERFYNRTVIIDVVPE